MKFYTGKKIFSLDDDKEYRIIGYKYNDRYNVYDLLVYDDQEKLYRISILPDPEENDEDNILERSWDDWQISVLTPEDIYYFFKDGEV